MKNIKVYSTPTCPFCILLKSWLVLEKIKFEDNDISKDSEAAAEMVKKTGQRGVPVTEIDGQFVIGFDKERLEKILLDGK